MPHAGPGRGAVLKVHALNAGDLDSVQALQKKKKKASCDSTQCSSSQLYGLLHFITPPFCKILSNFYFTQMDSLMSAFFF